MSSYEVTIGSEGLAKGLAPEVFFLLSGGWPSYRFGLSPLASEDIVAATFSEGDAFDDPAMINPSWVTIINGFLNTTPDETIFVKEIRFILQLPEPEPEPNGGGSSGCNTGSMLPFALLLLTPIFLFTRKR